MSIAVKPMTDASFASATPEAQFESLVRAGVQYQQKMTIRFRLADHGGLSEKDFRAKVDEEVAKRLQK